MQLTRFSDYSLRILMYLAASPAPRARAVDVAKAYGISLGHVSKVVAVLATEGFLVTHRGRDGGFELARPADEIRVGAVVRATESGAPLVECFDPEIDRCRITPVCGLKHALHAAQEAFIAELDRYTVADLVRRPAPLLELLSVRRTRRSAPPKRHAGRAS